MITQITPGVWVKTSDFLQSNAVLVQGDAGLLLVDPGITRHELSTLAQDITTLDQPVVAGFSTHPHWDHLLWDASFGQVPRYGTATAATEINNFFTNPHWQELAASMLPPDLADQIPIDALFGKTTALADHTNELPWSGPTAQVIEHAGHATGSAALFITNQGVLIAGDMLSDILIPFLELDSQDPIADYLAALDSFDQLADSVTVFVPGHGTVGDRDELRARIARDRAYVTALRDGSVSHDPRLTRDPNDKVHAWQVEQLAHKKAAL